MVSSLVVTELVTLDVQSTSSITWKLALYKQLLNYKLYPLLQVDCHCFYEVHMYYIFKYLDDLVDCVYDLLILID